MTDATSSTDLRPLVLASGEGPSYPMGRISAGFKADWAETAGRCLISEWRLDPHTQGPGAHSHPEDDVFFVLDDTMNFLVRDEWVDAPTRSFVLVPGGVTHDFENRGDTRAGIVARRRWRTLAMLSVWLPSAAPRQGRASCVIRARRKSCA